mmetsp:Transcript_18117/g.30014  ORF Transcript_18117/g.30014 Transcript_18117/m.30014 type:complete len:190 (+) Transcript_18117:150-719(+)
MASSVSNADSSQVMFVLIVFTIFLVTSALCFCCSVFRWRRNRRSRQETRLRAQIMHYNRRVAAVAAASMEQMSKEDEHDAAMRLQVLQVMFPEPKIDCTHLVYDCESKRYAWSNDEEKTVTADTCCSICLETCEPEDTVVTGICGHSYHRDCIVGWLQIKNECPYCRKPLWQECVFEQIKMEIKNDETV